MVGISLTPKRLERDKGADIQIGGTAFRLPAAGLLREFGRAGASAASSRRAMCLPSSRRLRNWAYVVITIPLNNDCAVSCRVSLIESPARKSLTQERIARLLGVRRVSITQAAVQLQGLGVIAYRRGHVRLVSRRKLEERSCACASIIRLTFEAVSREARSVHPQGGVQRHSRLRPVHRGPEIAAT